jgi:hypothetical protein
MLFNHHQLKFLLDFVRINFAVKMNIKTSPLLGVVFNCQNRFQLTIKLKQNFRPRLSRGGFVDLGMTEQNAVVFDSVLTHQQILDGHGAGFGKLLQLLRRQLNNG